MDAPMIDEDQMLSDAEEQRLYSYWNLDWSTSSPPPGSPGGGAWLELVQAFLAILGDAWAGKDEALAADLARQDDRIDELHRQLIQSLLEVNDQPSSVGPIVRLAMVSRYFERIGDHAVNMGERVRYFVTGNEEYLG